MKPVLDRDEIMEVRAVCREVLVAPHVQEYAIQLVMATQPEQREAHEMARKYVRYGSSPRGAQALVECGRVLALMRGRYHLSVDDVRARGARRPAPPHHPQLRCPCRRPNARDHPEHHHPGSLRPRRGVEPPSSSCRPRPFSIASFWKSWSAWPCAGRSPSPAWSAATTRRISPAPARSFWTIAVSTTATICARSTGAPTCAWKSCS